MKLSLAAFLKGFGALIFYSFFSPIVCLTFYGLLDRALTLPFFLKKFYFYKQSFFENEQGMLYSLKNEKV